MKQESERLAAVSRSEGGTLPGMRIRLLGGFRVERDGQALADSAWQRKSGKMLAKMLAVAPEHRLHREVLIDRLWPDADGAGAGNSLHQALLVMRRVLDSPRAGAKRASSVRLVDDIVSLVPEGISIDIDEFEALAAHGLKSGIVRDLTAAADAYGGELLPEDRYEAWAEERREPLARLYVQVLLALAEALERSGATFAAIERAHQALEMDRTREDAHRLVMRVSAVSGHRDGALRQYQLCRQALLEELGAEPDEATTALYEDILVGKLGGTVPEASDLVPLPAVPRRLANSLFTGRERALSIFRDKLAQLRAGSGSMVLISGEAGVGKTRLAVEAAVAAEEMGVLVLWGTSYAEEGQLPYGAIAEALEEYLRGLPTDTRERLAQRYPDLSRLITTVSLPDARDQPTDGRRMQLFTSIGRLLSEISSIRPVLLVLDDLHAADELSVQLVHYLARGAQKHPWLLVATYREEEVRPREALHGVIAACVRRGLADRIELLRLSRSEAGAMLRSLLDGEFDEDLLSEVYSFSLGNALFLEELIHTMRESGQIVQTGGRWRAVQGRSRPIPPGAADLVMARAARLSTDAARVADLAAVVGMECAPGLLREASSMTETAFFDAVDEIVGARLLEHRASANGREVRYAFHHPLFREALYANIAGPRRQHLHVAVGAAMERLSPGDVDALAYQWSRTSNDAKAVQYLELAADRAAARYAQEIAATLYRDAIARVDEQREPELTARLQSKLGKVLTQTGHYDDALILLDASRRYYDLTGNLEELTRTLALLVRAHRQQGTADEGLEVGMALLPHIQQADTFLVSSDVAAELFVALAGAARAAGRLEETIWRAETAGTLARAAGNDHALAMAESRRGDALGAMGRTEEATRILEEAKALAERTGSLTTVAEIYHNAGAFYTILGNSKKGQEYRALAADLCERLGYPANQAYALSELASAQFEEGRWDEARHTASRVLEIHESIDVSWYLPYALCVIGDIQLHSGERGAAHESFSRAHSLATERHDPQALVSALRGLADIDMLDGRPEAARNRLSAILAELDTENVDNPIFIAPTLVDALIELGELREAEDVLSRALTEAEAAGITGYMLSHLLRLKGRLHLGQEHWTEARSALEEAVALAHGADNPMAEGLARLELATLAQLGGDVVEARESCLLALHIFQSLGARPLLERTHAALAEIG